MSDFGDLVLVIGDLYIPTLCNTIPNKFKELLLPNKIQYLLCNGNIQDQNTLDYLYTLGNNIYINKGKYDVNVKDNSNNKQQHNNHHVVTIGDFVFVLYNNNNNTLHFSNNNTIDTDACILELCKYNGDILILGNQPHNSIIQYCNKLIISPGSLTGCSINNNNNNNNNNSSNNNNDTNDNSNQQQFDNIVPSFMLIAVKNGRAIVYTYELHNNEVSVTKTEHIKSK